jgi:nicotinamidase-related amidase
MPLPADRTAVVVVDTVNRTPGRGTRGVGIGERRSGVSRSSAASRPGSRDLWGAEVIDDLDVVPDDVSLIKTGSLGFPTSGLDSHLRNMHIEHVIYTGVITNGCVFLTAAGGMDRGYAGYLASDATATVTAATLQRTTERLVDGFIATVASTDVLIDELIADDELPARVNPVVAWSKEL